LPLGKEVVAAASGFARYYYCEWCGHSIKIDHQNGYQTTYMHLQKDGLVSAQNSAPVWVDSETVIGKVGMSGRTSGPHLHLSVTQDKNGNGSFDDFPEGLTDPFSWLDPYTKDPWETFTWNDALGTHTGSSSSYLWKHTFPIQRMYISGQDNVTVLGNKTVSVDLDDFESNLITATVVSYIKPYLPFSQLSLEYIEGTSVSVTAEDHYEEDVISIDGKITITIDLNDLNLNKVVKDTLKIYFWNRLVQGWEPLPTVIDYVSNKLAAETNHLSHFVVLGEKIYPNPPISLITLEGNEPDGWFTTYPLTHLLAEDFSGLGIKAIYYSINNGIDWKVYSNPFYIEQDGVSTILYRAEDFAGNLEDTNSKVVKIDTKGRWKGSITITGSAFETSTY